MAHEQQAGVRGLSGCAVPSCSGRDLVTVQLRDREFGLAFGWTTHYTALG